MLQQLNNENSIELLEMRVKEVLDLCDEIDQLYGLNEDQQLNQEEK